MIFINYDLINYFFFFKNIFILKKCHLKKNIIEKKKEFSEKKDSIKKNNIQQLEFHLVRDINYYGHLI